MVWIIIVVICGLALTGGVAVAYVLGLGAVLSFLATDQAQYLAILPQRVFSQIDVFTFLAMPLFILAGELMTRGGVTKVLIDLAMLLVGRLKGGLGHVNIATSVFLAGISGSAVADAAATTNTLVPEMQSRGYPADFAAALTAASCVIGPIIPPSIVMIFYGALMNVSVAALFAGGVVPGLLMALSLFIYNAWVARRNDHPGGKDSVLPAFVPTIIKALPAMAIPVIVVAGIVFGFVTPTEAAALAVAVTLVLVGVYEFAATGSVSKSVRVLASKTNLSLEKSILLTGSIFMILFAAAVFGYLLAINGVPEMIAGVVASADLSGVVYLLVVSLVLFLAGMVMDVAMALVLLVPLLIPAAIATGADPVHVGVITCLNLTLGLISPPFGGCLMVVSASSGVSYARLSRAVIPFIGVEVVVLLILILAPDLTLFVPRLTGLIP